MLLPRRCIHSKLYILHGPTGYRVIQGSANLTETARQGTNQINYVWYADMREDDPWLVQVLRDYEAQRTDCQLFMGDLADLIRHCSDRDTEALVEAWPNGSTAEANDSKESRRVLQDLAARSLRQVQDKADPIFTISLPEAPQAKREVERILAPLGAITRDYHVTVDSHTFLRYVEQTLPVPLMRLDLVAMSIQLALGGQIGIRSEPPTDASAVDKALAHIEKYVATLDWGQSRDPQFAKSSLFEALLCLLSSPFAHEHRSTPESLTGGTLQQDQGSLRLAHLQAGIAPTDDELHTARAVFRDLYACAQRPVPAFFPARPLEQTFKDDMQHTEVRAAPGHLPQTVKHQLKGKTVVIESPTEFESWLNSGQSKGETWLAHWWRKLWR